MRNEKLDLLVTFDKNYIEPFKVMLGYAKYCISPFLWKDRGSQKANRFSVLYKHYMKLAEG